MSEDPTIVRGPLAPSPGSGVIYQVTLANGQMVTRPEGWQDNHLAPTQPVPREEAVREQPQAAR